MRSFDELLQRKEDLEKDFFKYNEDKITAGKKNILSKQIYKGFIKSFHISELTKGEQIVFRQIFSYLLHVEFKYTAISISMLLNITNSTVLHSVKVIKADLIYNRYRIIPHIEKIRDFLKKHELVR